MTSGETDALRSQYRIGTRIIALVCMGMVAVLGGLAHPLLGVWLGEEFAASGTWVLRILLMAYAAGACFTLPSVAADAAGRPGLPAGVLSVASLVHVPLVLLGIHAWGIVGAALGLLAGMILLVFGAGVIHRRLAELPSLSVALRETRGALLAGFLTGSLALLVARSPFPSSGIGPLLLSLLGMGLVYVLFLYVFRGFLPEDARRLLGLLRDVQRGPNPVFHENRLRASRER
ncbi:MAG TPA: polysaccharide biosynthesis C-terminal domain-containing protein, partial [Candidatus Eisenbacteria bacterium]|nr:polysaccharide biosynthesis C-terminal domain-containing protein [Candidatus Eisenbacteria bacterium]